MAKIRESIVIPGNNMWGPASGFDFNPWSVDAFNNGSWPYGALGITGVNPFSTSQQYDNGSGYFRQVYLTNYQLKQVRERARWLYAYNEYCVAVVNLFKSYVVGDGFKYEVTGVHNNVPEKLIEQAQNVIELFAEKNDIQEMELEYVYRLLVEGEACARVFEDSDGLLTVRWVENDLILPPSDSNDPDISFGIACRHDDIHDIKGYWIVTRPYEGQIPELISAEEINYDKVMTYSNNKRGLSTTFPVTQNFVNAEQILNSMISLAISRSKVSMIRKIDNATPEGVNSLLQKTTNVQITNPYPGQGNLNLEQLPNSSVLTSTANIEYEFPEIKLGAVDSEVTLMANLRAIAACYGISETHLTQKLDGGSYAAHIVQESPSFKTFSRWQKKLGDFFASRRTKPHQSLMWKQLCYAVKKGLLPSNALTELKIVPTGPSLLTRDPVQEAQANQIYFDMGIKSANQVASEQGYEYDEQKKQRMDDQGLENILKSVASIKSVGVTQEAGRKLMKQYHPNLPDDTIDSLFSTSEADEIRQGGSEIKPEQPAVKKPKETKGAKRPKPPEPK
jgi:hypothetical protein